jgi:hypothetical protein
MHRTDAHALAAILGTVNEIEQPTLNQRWSQALGARLGSKEMGQRHAEVVNLLTGTMDQVAALPDEKRQTYEPYFMAWWTAVVSPEAQWGGQTKGSKIISREHLSLLTSVGDVVEARMDRSPSAPGAFNLGQIAEQCAEWLEALQEPGEVADPFRRSLIQALNHVQWLIENVALFGVARVAKAANTVTGEVIQAIPHVRRDARKIWAQRLATWTATLMVFTAFNTASVEAIESTERLVSALTDVAVQVVDALDQASDHDGPPAIGQ